MTTNAPEGGLFSLVYLRTDEVFLDNERMRRRLSSLFQVVLGDRDTDFGKYLEAELGVRIVRFGTMSAYVDWDEFFDGSPSSDVLDSVTLLARHLKATGTDRMVSSLRVKVQRIFDELQIGYQLDERCGVHRKIDGAFQANREIVLKGLGGDRFRAARQHLEMCDKALLGDSMDGRQAIRCVFDAVENVFKLTWRATHVNGAEIANKLRPAVERLFAGENEFLRANLKEVESFKAWVEAAHFYRHEAGRPEPTQPADDLTILMVSQGLSFVRWLAWISELERTRAARDAQA